MNTTLSSLISLQRLTGYREGDLESIPRAAGGGRGMEGAMAKKSISGRAEGIHKARA
jgi:hypothetical protein